MNQELTKNDTAFLKKVINELNNPLREKIDDDPYEEFNQHIKREKDYEQITSFYNMLFPTIDERTDLISEDIISNASMNNTSHINNIDKKLSKQTISKTMIGTGKNDILNFNVDKELKKIKRHEQQLEKQLLKVNKLNEKLKKKFEKEKKRQGKQKAIERKKEKRER